MIRYSEGKGKEDMPGKIPEHIESVGGFMTEYGRSRFVEKQNEIRQRVLRDMPKYREISDVLNDSEYAGTLSKNAADYAAKRKGKRMPAKLNANDIQLEAINGNRGRKAVFPNFEEWKLDIGEIADVTDEMLSEITSDDYEGDLRPEHLFDKNNSEGNKYRKNRFSNMVTAARKANGEKSSYSPHTFELNGETRFAIRRDKDKK